MLAEYVSGGLDGERLRVIAARVVAVRRLVEGVGFDGVFDELTRVHGVTQRAAFTIAVRVFRGGGLTKDAIYLRGLVRLLDHFRNGHDVAPLLAGKIGFDQIPLVEELVRRDVLRPPALIPRWLARDPAAARLDRVRAGMRPLDLIEQDRSVTP
jgi:hypothetical protein